MYLLFFIYFINEDYNLLFEERELNQKQYMNYKIGKVAEWLKAIDCKSLEFFLRRFESYLSHLQIIIQFNKQFFSDNNYVLYLILK